uniref:Uncharacterized protein n=2 Tax=Ixodes scapularis TaxID=6945 RepID=A0A1S4LAU1_IXOSC
MTGTFYNGDVPTLVVKDLDFLSYVFIKNFSNFMNRGPRSMDILQIMLEAETDESFEETEVKNGEIKVQKKLTPTEVYVNTGVLLIAGFGTTSVALSNLSFVLAKYPEVQDKVREEVNAAMRKHGRINYAAVTEDLKYLSNVVDETLRIYPVVV